MQQDEMEEDHLLPVVEDADAVWCETGAQDGAEQDPTQLDYPATRSMDGAVETQSSAANGTGQASSPGVQPPHDGTARLLATRVSAGSLTEVLVGFKQRRELAHLLPGESVQALGTRVEAALLRVQKLRAALSTP